MEQDFGSECSSGCESGWTFYLGHSMYTCNSHQKYKNCEDDDDDDGMSMVSDASSGPPHIQEQEQECNNQNNGVSNGWKTDKVQNHQDSLEKSSNIIVSYSEEHHQSESRFQDQFGGFKSCFWCSIATKPMV